jgi:hypothetical protein
MKKKNILLLTTLLLIQFVYSQEKWNTVKLNGWATIQMPPTMEIQSGTYKKIMDEIKREISIMNKESCNFPTKWIKPRRR